MSGAEGTIRAPYFPAGAAEPGPEQEWESAGAYPGGETYYEPAVAEVGQAEPEAGA
jgi:hypothetical protein